MNALVSTATGTLASAGLARINLSTSEPESRGIIRSSTTKSGAKPASCLMASSPSNAVRTSNSPSVSFFRYNSNTKASSSTRRIFFMGSSVDQGSRRKVDGEGRALPGRGLDVQRAATFLDESLHDVQSQTGALAGILGREVGLKNLGQEVRRDARAVVADGQADQRGEVVEILHVQQSFAGHVFETAQVQRFGQLRAGELNHVRLGRRLK